MEPITTDKPVDLKNMLLHPEKIKQSDAAKLDNINDLTTSAAVGGQTLTEEELINHKPGIHDYDDEMDQLFKASAMGGFTNQMQMFFTGLDKYHQNILPPNVEHSGVTFITRPKLNLTSSSLRQSRVLMAMDTIDPTSIPFAIRCLLDTKFSKDKQVIAASETSPLFNYHNPFLTPVCTGLTGMSGWPDPVIQTETTEGGFHSEDQTYVIGSDGLRKSYDLTLNFKDIQFGPIAAIFEYWTKWMELAVKGLVVPYAEDIDALRLSYTVSIYRFVLDPSRKYIMRYAKATGCFPKSVPIGGMFNISDYKAPVEGIGQFSIPFQANHVSYNDHSSLLCFNQLMKRYCPGIDEAPDYPIHPSFNFVGLPYIISTDYGLRLVWKDVSGIVNEPSRFNLAVAAILKLNETGAKRLIKTYETNSVLTKEESTKAWDLWRTYQAKQKKEGK